MVFFSLAFFLDAASFMRLYTKSWVTLEKRLMIFGGMLKQVLLKMDNDETSFDT
jgi:hypothetical protein